MKEEQDPKYNLCYQTSAYLTMEKGIVLQLVPAGLLATLICEQLQLFFQFAVDFQYHLLQKYLLLRFVPSQMLIHSLSYQALTGRVLECPFQLGLKELQ